VDFTDFTQDEVQLKIFVNMKMSLRVIQKANVSWSVEQLLAFIKRPATLG
jgi:hypothetical protein